ncbi:MAG: hypothetical protein HKN03_08755 [Acidimicrobiales bacterium]|nr:hypothetical protein [Acidimicrobiales bacterium]
MSDPSVVNSEMNPSNLSDAEIDSIISGTPVAGAPAHLSEFVALLSAEFDATPGVTPGLALADFISAPPVAPGAPGAGTNTVTSIFKKSTAVVGAVSFKILLGAAAAAAGVGGAQAAGVIDLPRLGSEPTGVEIPTDPGDSQLGPSTSVTASGSPSITVPGSSSDTVSVPPFAQLAEPENSLETPVCTPTRGPTNASSTSNPSEANRQASSACSEVGDGQGDRPADEQRNGPASGKDDNQGQGSGSSNGDEDDLKPAKPARSQQPQSSSSSSSRQKN